MKYSLEKSEVLSRNDESRERVLKSNDCVHSHLSSLNSEKDSPSNLMFRPVFGFQTRKAQLHQSGKGDLSQIRRSVSRAQGEHDKKRYLRCKRYKENASFDISPPMFFQRFSKMAASKPFLTVYATRKFRIRAPDRDCQLTSLAIFSKPSCTSRWTKP